MKWTWLNVSATAWRSLSNGQLIEQDTVSEVFSHPKTPLAQQFIQSTLHLDIPDDYQARSETYRHSGYGVPMLRMEFTGHSVDAAASL